MFCKVDQIPDTCCSSCDSMIPLFGRTQYCLGAVVFTLNPTFSFVGLVNLRDVVTISLNGPISKGGGRERKKEKESNKQTT